MDAISFEATCDLGAPTLCGGVAADGEIVTVMLPPIEVLLVCIPALPLAAAVVTALLGARVLKSRSHWPVVAAIIVSFFCSAALVLQVRRAASDSGGRTAVKLVTLWTWANVDAADDEATPAGQPRAMAGSGRERDFRIDVVLRADGLTAVMLAMVTLVSSLVAIFAIGYMHGDRGYWRFFSYIGLFVFSMTMLVSVSNFALLYVFWEAVGLCSYLLIGFWYEKPEAAAAGKKAFLVNRVGDFGFAVAIFSIWTVYGTLNFHDASATTGEPVAAATAAAEPGGQTVIAGVLGPRASKPGTIAAAAWRWRFACC